MAEPPDAGPPRAFSHIDETGRARMVDVSAKEVTTRHAMARGRVRLSAEVVAMLRGEADDPLPKGDALSVAEIAGIMGAKKTPELIPLCHPIALTDVDVDVVVTDAGVEITAITTTNDRTGVEMESLTAVAVAALTVVDMVKAVDKHAVIDDVRVVGKSGGRSGSWGQWTATSGAAARGEDA